MLAKAPGPPALKQSRAIMDLYQRPASVSCLVAKGRVSTADWRQNRLPGRRHSNCCVFAKSCAVLRAQVLAMKTISCTEQPLTEVAPPAQDERQMKRMESSKSSEPGELIAQENERLIRENARLTQEYDLLRTLIDSLPDRIFIKDRQSRFLINNPAHVRALGATCQDEVIGKTDLDIFPAELARQYYNDEPCGASAPPRAPENRSSGTGPAATAQARHWSAPVGRGTPVRHAYPSPIVCGLPSHALAAHPRPAPRPTSSQPDSTARTSASPRSFQRRNLRVLQPGGPRAAGAPRLIGERSPCSARRAPAAQRVSTPSTTPGLQTRRNRRRGTTLLTACGGAPIILREQALYRHDRASANRGGRYAPHAGFRRDIAHAADRRAASARGVRAAGQQDLLLGYSERLDHAREDLQRNAMLYASCTIGTQVRQSWSADNVPLSNGGFKINEKAQINGPSGKYSGTVNTGTFVGGSSGGRLSSAAPRAPKRATPRRR